jgi:NAD(P)-dependent dehydrogenase (short-subunit alcohol dehydrogenase family)
MKRTVLITGAARRIGAAVAQYLASEKWEVILHYNHSYEDAILLSEKLKSRYSDRSFPVVQCDLSNSDAVLSFFRRLPDDIETIDALVNNASTFNRGKVSETSPVLLRKEFAVNFEAPFFLIQSFQNTFGVGAIVNMLDTKIVKNEGDYAAYLLAKKTLSALTKMAALNFAPDLRVNGIAPGPVLPPPGKSPDYLNDIICQTPLKKQVELKHIAASVSFLLNNPSVTGQIIFCDSGSHLI